MGEHYDLWIRGGLLVDGSGARARRADIGVRDGRIAALGELRGSATRQLDVDGQVVAPGFVDIHTHYDAQILWDRMLTISPWHGVTSVVMGNCGFGIAPTRRADRQRILETLESVEGMSLETLQAGLGEDWGFESFPEYLDAVEACGSAINVAALIGHTPLRLFVLGDEATEREARPEEIAEMSSLVEQALRAGALGFATSKSPTHVGYAGRPVPSRAASLDEIHALAGALHSTGSGVMQATVGPGFFVRELADLQRKLGRTVSWTALLSDLLDHRALLAQHAELQADGVEVVPQVSCRPLVFEYQWKAPFPFESLPLFAEVAAADHAGKLRIYADPEFRRAFRGPQGRPVLGGSWEKTLISECPGEPALCGRSVAEVAAERGVDAADLALDLGLATQLEARFRVSVMNTQEDSVAELLNHPAVVLGLSDAGAHASQLCDAGFATHLLGHWVRERGSLELEQAVRLLSGRAAEVFGIRDRGRLEVGLAADVVVFDPQTVGCSPLRRVHDQPAGADRLVADATGIHAVVVNGRLLRIEGRDQVEADAELPGRLLRGGVAA